MSNQWMEFEADNYYLRRKKRKEKKVKSFDLPLFLMELYSIKPKKVLEIGASEGDRLAKIHRKYKAKVSAIEPSNKAVNDGKKMYPFIEFTQGTSERLDAKEEYDLIIVNFVFHWIYREDLLMCVQKIDTALKNKGILIIGDFGTEYFIKKKYHHLKNADFYTWKMPYWEIFTKSGRYTEIAKLHFNQDRKKISYDIDINNMGTGVILRKQDMFIEL